MRKITVLLASLITTIGASAQITITSADMPNDEDTIRVSIASSTNGADEVLAGADQIWDFSGLIPDSQGVENFVPISGSPVAYQFAFNNVFLYPEHVSNLSQAAPDINMMDFLTLTNVYNYFDNETGAYRQTGFGANISGAPLPIRYDSIETIYAFPMNYQDVWESELSWEATVPSLGYYSQYKQIENEVEGWGTLVLPNGTYQVLKVKKTIQETDSVYVDQFGFGSQFDLPESIEYHFLAPGKSIPVMKVTTNAGVVREVLYQDDFDPTISILENKQIEVSVYPNPTNGMIYVENSDKIKSMELIDAQGKIRTIKNGNTIDLSSYSSGIYFLKLTSINGTVISKRIMKK